MQAVMEGLDRMFSWVKTGRPGARSTQRAKRQLFLNYKGGTGKTSISAAYGYYLASTGKRVLMVDLDAQAHLTTCFNQNGMRHDKSLYSVIVRGSRLSELITPTSLATLKIIPSTTSLSSMELPLYRMPYREFRLRQALKRVERDFDFIIIDSAPNIGLLSLNAILASDEILVPLLADFLSRHERDRRETELLVILALIIIVTFLSFVFLGDAVADLISLIGGHVDEETLVE